MRPAVVAIFYFLVTFTLCITSNLEGGETIQNLMLLPIVVTSCITKTNAPLKSHVTFFGTEYASTKSWVNASNSAPDILNLDFIFDFRLCCKLRFRWSSSAFPPLFSSAIKTALPSKIYVENRNQYFKSFTVFSEGNASILLDKFVYISIYCKYIVSIERVQRLLWCVLASMYCPKTRIYVMICITKAISMRKIFHFEYSVLCQ